MESRLIKIWMEIRSKEIFVILLWGDSSSLKFYDFSKNEDSTGERHDTIMQTTRTERQEFVPSYY